MPKHSPWTALNPILLKGNLSTSDGFSRYQPGWLPAFPKLLMIRACDRNEIWWGRICCNCYGTQCTCSQEKNRPNQFLQLVCVLSWETLAMTPEKWCLAIRWFGNYKYLLGSPFNREYMGTLGTPSSLAPSVYHWIARSLGIGAGTCNKEHAWRFVSPIEFSCSWPEVTGNSQASRVVSRHQ